MTVLMQIKASGTTSSFEMLHILLACSRQSCTDMDHDRRLLGCRPWQPGTAQSTWVWQRSGTP